MHRIEKGGKSFSRIGKLGIVVNMIRTEAMRRSFVAEHSPEHSTDEMRERQTSVVDKTTVVLSKYGQTLPAARGGKLNLVFLLFACVGP